MPEAPRAYFERLRSTHYDVINVIMVTEFVSLFCRHPRLLMLCRRSTVISWPGLLRIPFGQLRRNRGQVTEQTSGAVVRPSGKVHLGGRCTCGIGIGRADGRGAECPDAIYG